MDIAAAQRAFEARGTFLNTASLGLPPRATTERLNESVQRWSRGELTPTDVDAPMACIRSRYADLVGANPSTVAIGSQTSQLLGIIAANLPDNAEVLVASGDFTSVLFPFLAQQRRGVVVREAPLADLPGEIGEATTAVVCSAVQSADGRLLDTDALQQACASTGTRSVIDITQAAGWLPLDASRFDVTVCSAYKWLLSPRGVAYLTVAADIRRELVVHSASWAGGQVVWDSIYGTPLRLSPDARGLDVSPVWFSVLGQEPSLELLSSVGVPAIHAHDVALAQRFTDAFALPSGGSAIVSIDVADGASDALRAAGVQHAVRAGRVRLSFHLYNTEQDVDRVVEVLTPYV